MENSQVNSEVRRRHHNGKRREESGESMTMMMGGGQEEFGVEEGDAEVWNQFATTFNRVQTVLDRNRDLIQRVNQNHQSRVPDNMARNVVLIQELNGNISKVVDLYSDLSGNFSSGFRQQQHQQQGGGNGKGVRSGGNSSSGNN